MDGVSYGLCSVELVWTLWTYVVKNIVCGQYDQCVLCVTNSGGLGGQWTLPWLQMGG